MAFAQKFRLPVSAFFEKSRHQRALILFGNGFSLKAIQNTLGFNRFAIVIGLRVHKKATQRHLLKRMVSSVLEHVSPQSLDVLIVLSPDIIHKTRQEVQDSLKNVWRDVESRMIVNK